VGGGTLSLEVTAATWSDAGSHLPLVQASGQVRVFDLLRQMAGIAVPVFVVTSMLNVGLTQKPTKILEHLRNWRFLVRMVLVNLVVVPALMIAAVSVVEMDLVYAAGLIVFGMAAGAPFLIKLTATSGNDLALGATALMVLMVSTVVILPVALPLVLEGVTVDSGAIITSLLGQMIAPLVLGMVLAEVAVRLVAVIQPRVAGLSNIALYVVIVATLVGYAPELGGAVEGRRCRARRPRPRPVPRLHDG
jgi:bile acid:Na+ symporter, BASS family